MVDTTNQSVLPGPPFIPYFLITLQHLMPKDVVAQLTIGLK